MKRIFTLSFLFIALHINAQKKDGFIPPSIDDEDIPVAKTELPAPEDGQDYVVKYFKGTTDGIESRIAIKKLGYILRPAMVQVFSEDGRELAIELVKKNWDDVVRSGSTNNGEFQTSFKTAMEFGIKISASEIGIPFIVAVSAGVELFPASNLFVDAGTMRSSTDNGDNSNVNEGSISKDEQGSSNNSILIIIAFALVGILALLAVLLYRKKGKNVAPVLLVLFAFWPANANLVVGVAGSAVGSFAGNLTTALAKFYGSGGYNGDGLLSDDDKDHEPEADPRGQPSLPSSCYDIARISQSRGSSGSNGPKGGSPSKNPTGDMGLGGTAGGNSGTSSGNFGTGSLNRQTGSSVGSGTGSQASPNSETQNNNSNAEMNQALEEARIEYENLNLDSEKSYQEGLARARSAYDHITGVTREDYNAAREAARDDAEEQARLASAFTSRIAELTTLNNQRIAELNERKNRMLSQNATYYSNRVAEIMVEYADRDQDGTDGSGEGKDPNSDPQKDIEGEEGAKGGGKGVGDPGGSGSPGGLGDGNPGGGDNNNDNEGCDCLERAYKELQDNRHTLEKLLKIGQHTKKVTDFGISFGDNFSGVHAVSGLAWQTERAKVLKSMEKFDKTYDNKYNELIDKLYNTLIWIDDCEKKLGYDNWYSHSGFIYYEFMKVRYASYK